MMHIARIAFVCTLFSAFFSCKEELSPLEYDLIDGSNFYTDIDSLSTVKAFNFRTGPVQSSNLPVYQLGVLNDPDFGATTAGILAQVTLASISPTFGENPEIDSVFLSIPYFSTVTSTEDDATTYQLDSIFGNGPFRLSIYESNYYLRDYDPDTGFTEFQRYYSDQAELFEGFLGELLYEDEGFSPDEDEVVLITETDTTRLPPRVRIPLPADFFQSKIINQEGTDALSSNNNFKNHFRGLYFKAEAINSEGTLIIPDFREAGIEMHYSLDNPDGESEDERIDQSLSIGFQGIAVNTLSQELDTGIATAVDDPDTNPEALYLKGGPGTMAVIELFDGDSEGNSVELDDFRDRNILVNEANLEFYVKEGSLAPKNIFVYDLNNDRILLDYALDPSDPVNSENPPDHHLVPVIRDSDDNAVSYKVRLTNHINELLANPDSTNVKLGLSVTGNTRTTAFREIKEPGQAGDGAELENVPAGDIITPRSVILHGPGSPDEEKRLRLRLYYTEVDD